MIYRTFKNGDPIPALGLGTWKAEKGQAYTTVRKAIQLGYRHFDCAYIYDNEREIGAAIQDAIMMGEVNREELFITTKLWNTHHKAEDVTLALKHSLQDLELMYVDLFLIHWPVAQKKRIKIPTSAEDMVSLQKIPLTETWKGMEECVETGLARHIGVSNFSIPNLEAVNEHANIKVEMNQVELHPLLPQNELREYCNEHKILMTAYSPLGSRDRHPKMKAHDEPDLFNLPVVQDVGQKHSITPAQALLAWSINRGHVAIPKSSNEERLLQNLEAADIALLDEDIKLFDTIGQQYRYVKGDFFCFEGSEYTVDGLWDIHSS